MTGLWNTPGVPHKGWSIFATNDHDEPSHICEMCKVTLCRYTHVVSHPDYPAPLEVGTVCGAHLCEIPQLKSVERRLLRAQQRARNLEWQQYETGSIWCETTIGREPVRAVVLAVRGRFGAKLTIGRRPYHYSEFTTRAAAQQAIETSIAHSAREQILSTLTA